MRAVLVLLVVACAFALKPPIVKKELIFTKFQYTYVHACSLSQLKDGTVVVVFHGGPHEDDKDSTIYFARKDPKTGEWSEPKIAAKTPGVCNANPAMYQNPQGHLFVDFHMGGGLTDPTACSTKNWHGRYTWSYDGGVTWGDAAHPSGIDLPSGYLGGIKNKCIDISNGAVLCPASTEGVLKFIPWWRSHIETTNQNFSTWSHKSNNIDFPGCPFGGVIQPTLFETSPGEILALMRSDCQIMAKSVSHDYGRSFTSPIEPVGLPNPSSGIDGVKMADQPDIGLILLFNNSTSSRTPLTLAHSTDAGKTWQHLVEVEADPSGSFAYPAIVQSKINPREALTCYSYNDQGQKSIAFASIEFPSNG